MDKVKTFIKETNYDKFDISNNEILFCDGEAMSGWFYDNKTELLKMGKIKVQYDTYNKMLEFIKCNNYDKFKFHLKELRFSDGGIMSVWFANNRSKILNGTSLLATKIKKQYWCFNNRRLIEFSKITNLDKFDKKAEVKFKDNTFTYNYFTANKDKILSQTDKYSRRIQKQFFIYENRKAIEFSKINDLDKFNQNSDVRFKSGRKASDWFRVQDKNVIFTSPYSFNKKIAMDYYRYKNKPFEKRLYEYMTKYLDFDSKVTFKDGVNVSWWVRNFNDNISLILTKMVSDMKEDGLAIPKYIDEAIKKHK